MRDPHHNPAGVAAAVFRHLADLPQVSVPALEFAQPTAVSLLQFP